MLFLFFVLSDCFFNFLNFLENYSPTSEFLGSLNRMVCVKLLWKQVFAKFFSDLN